MAKVIAWTRPDGGVSITIPAILPGETEDDAIERVFNSERDIPPEAVNKSIIDTSELPADRTFRGAWKQNGTPVPTVDMTAAKTIHMDRIRLVRDTKLAALDIEVIKALGAGDSAKVAELEADKQALRDLPQTFDLSVAKNPDELKELWPTNLDRYNP